MQFTFENYPLGISTKNIEFLLGAESTVGTDAEEILQLKLAKSTTALRQQKFSQNYQDIIFSLIKKN